MLNVYKPFTIEAIEFTIVSTLKIYLKGPTVDRFCGGQLNSESDEDFSIPIYCEVTSNVVWMQVCIIYAFNCN